MLDSPYSKRVMNMPSVARYFGELQSRAKADVAQRTAAMRVNALVDMPEHEAVGELTYLTLRARVLALNMLAIEPCARIVHAMDPKPRAEVIDSVDSRVGEMVTQLLIDTGYVSGEGETPRRDQRAVAR